MIPLRDVIPTRTTPYVTVTLIVLNSLVFLYELSLPDEALEGFVRQRHSYDTPQWLHWPADASPAYAAWLSEACSLS